MAVCLSHREGEVFFGQSPNQVAAEVFDISGAHLGTLPSNVGEEPAAEYEAEHIWADEQLSGDGSVYAFSSLNYSYAPGGVTVVPGSAYVDNIETGVVELISLQPGLDEPIEQDNTANTHEFIRLPAISTDGSHVLMSVEGSDGPNHLYMRVGGGGGETFDVSEGHGVTYLGTNRSGTIVDFAATQQLTGEDTDNSSDIYQWREDGNGHTLTLISQGNGNGNSDLCSPVGGFATDCGAEPLQPERGPPFAGMMSAPFMDDYLASDSGDVFFYSPENLDPARTGLRNQKNLYEYHDGAVHLVATLEPDTKVNRIQISPDGVHAGILTASNLTGYDSRGRREMYTYDAASGKIRCASCRPDGLPPFANATASQNGRFMSDDGRVFFATKEGLVDRDVNVRISDVYEFVDGRPQLITSGTSSRDATSATQLRNIGNFPPAASVGLEAVSADGTDVYFATYDVLAPQDENAAFLKIYDARSGGGFLPPPTFAGCEAADECHNEGSQTPPPPVVGSAAPLGGTGNATPGAKKKKHRRKPHHKRHHRKRAARVGSDRRG
jgi:hypothetical protein